MKYHIKHSNLYKYAEPVSLCHNLVHLRARDCAWQVPLRHELLVVPEPEALQQRIDYFGNPVTFFTIQEPHRQLSVTADSWIEVNAPPELELTNTLPWEHVRDLLQHDTNLATLDASQFVFDSPYVCRSDALAEYAAPSFAAGAPLGQAVRDLTRRIHSEFRYDRAATTLATPIRDVLAHRCGVCQDFAHLQIGCLRSLGLAARYVSGYLLTRPRPGQQLLVGADASHAWLSVYCPTAGWIDFDPTNDQTPGDQHITLACGRDYDDVSPVKGIILGGGSNTMSVGVDVVAVR